MVFWRIAALAWMGLIFAGSAWSGGAGGETASMFGNLNAFVRTAAHVVEFGVLALLVSKALTRPGQAIGWRARGVAAVISILYAFSDEFHQSFVPGRYDRWEDIIADATGVVHFMLHRLAELLDSLEVFPERMRQNLEASRGGIFSGAVLLALARHGLSRQEAYRLVQKQALLTWDEGGHLYDRLSQDPEVQKLLKPEELTECFDLDRQLGHVGDIFERVLAEPSSADEGRR